MTQTPKPIKPIRRSQPTEPNAEPAASKPIITQEEKLGDAYANQDKVTTNISFCYYLSFIYKEVSLKKNWFASHFLGAIGNNVVVMNVKGVGMT